MGNPSQASCDGKDYTKHVTWNLQSFKEKASIEIYIGIKISRGEIGIFKTVFLELKCYFKERVRYLEFFKEAKAHLFDNLSPWIVILVNSMPKAHQFLFFVLNLLDKFRNVLNRANFSINI
jgi:hypothetical protein